jgi:hypothetical protein
LAGQAGDPLQQPHQKLPPDDRGQLYGTFAILTEAVQASHDNPLDSVWNAYLCDSLHHAVVTILPTQDTEVEQCLGNFLNEERHPFGFLHQRRREFLRKLVSTQHPTGHCSCIGF